MSRVMLTQAIAIVVAAVLLSCCSPAPAPVQPAAGEEAYTFGLLMVGPYNDHGWSQAHFDAGQYVQQQVPKTRMLYLDKVNPADRPGTTVAQLAESLLARGARMIIFNSDDMKDGAIEFCRAHRDVPVIHISGDSAWQEGRDYKGLPNLVNVMGRIEYSKMMAGFVAALTSRSGKIAYLGPLDNEETRRLVAAVYLGARHGWTRYLKKDPQALSFKVSWIGFWFHIPGVTSDPTQVTDQFFNEGYDVVISGLDSTEALTEARKFHQAGKWTRAIQYSSTAGCSESPEVCLGTMYFNWGPYLKSKLLQARSGRWEPGWDWLGPDWKDINNPDTSMVGFQPGPALSPEVASHLDRFIRERGGGLNLWTGPLNYQDGPPFLASGQTATDPQVWYLPQLLQGIQGQSATGK